MAMAPSGRLIRKIAGHPNASVNTPPTSGPTTTASATQAPHSPIIRACCRRSGNPRTRRESAPGATAAAPIPCTSRPAISVAVVGATAHTNEPTVNTVRPPR
jgi:hypothetical protein